MKRRQVHRRIRYRLLHKLQLGGRCCNPKRSCGFQVPGVVGVTAQLHIGADGGADCEDRLRIRQWVAVPAHLLWNCISCRLRLCTLELAHGICGKDSQCIRQRAPPHLVKFDAIIRCDFRALRLQCTFQCRQEESGYHQLLLVR